MLQNKGGRRGEEGVTVRPLAPVVSCALSRSEGHWSLSSGGEKTHSFTELLLEMAFHAQGHEWTCRTTSFPSAMCPWASVSSYQQPLYLIPFPWAGVTEHSVSLPSIRAATGDAQNYWFQLLFRALQPTGSFTHFIGWQDHKRTKRKMGFHVIVEGMGNAEFEKQNYSPRLL